MKLATIIILLSAASILIGWDIYVYLNAPPDCLITSVIWNTAREHPVLPFIAGFVAGHLFWGRGKTT
jgi:hypothetical protein